MSECAWRVVGRSALREKLRLPCASAAVHTDATPNNTHYYDAMGRERESTANGEGIW